MDRTIKPQDQTPDVVLVTFGLERPVYRLSISDHRDRFVLKGGMLVTLWSGETGRFTPSSRRAPPAAG